MIVSACEVTNLSQQPHLSPASHRGAHCSQDHHSISLQSPSWLCGLSGTLEPKVLAKARSRLHLPSSPGSLQMALGKSVKVVFLVFSLSRHEVLLFSFKWLRKPHSGKKSPSLFTRIPETPVSPPDANPALFTASLGGEAWAIAGVQWLWDI